MGQHLSGYFDAAFFDRSPNSGENSLKYKSKVGYVLTDSSLILSTGSQDRRIPLRGIKTIERFERRRGLFAKGEPEYVLYVKLSDTALISPWYCWTLVFYEASSRDCLYRALLETL